MMWDYENEMQQAQMEEPVTAENCGAKLKLVREVSGLSRKELATIIGCSDTTIFRLETGKTTATKDFLSRLAGLTVIGQHKFQTLTEAEKDTISETLGAAGGVLSGISGSIAAVSAAGSVGGLSAAGITSGLAAIGGGTLLGGIGTIAAIPVAAGLAGYGLVKGIRAICDANNLECQEIDGRYEIAPLPHVEEAESQ